MFGWEEKDLLMGNQQATLFGGRFDSGDAPKKKTVVEEKPKPKMKSLDDFF